MAAATVQKAPAPQPAPAPKPASDPATALKRAPSLTALQDAPPAVRLNGDKAPAGNLAPGILDLKGMTDFLPPAPIAEFLDANKKSVVNAQFGTIAQGAVEVHTVAAGNYQIKSQKLALNHPAFARAAEFVPGLVPALLVNVQGTKMTGRIGLAAGEKFEELAHHIQKAPDLLGLAGFSLPSTPAVTNSLEGGSLHFGMSGVAITLGSAFNGTFNFELIDTNVTFSGNANVAVGGLATGSLELARAADGVITGKANVALQLPKNFSGSVDVAWDGTVITGVGKVGYKGEKFSGEVTLNLMEKNQALQLAKTKTAPQGTETKPAATPGKAPVKIQYVVFGEGDLAFSFTDWLHGTAHVIVDPKGNVTVIGEIKPQKEFILFEQKDYDKQLFKIEARAAYGLPVVGDIFIFANASMNLFASLGPAKFYNIVVAGTYSTDPTVAKDFSIQGSLNISAVAGARLRAEAGVGIEILSHDIKAGAGINGIAGVKAYAEATPVIGYREKGAEGQDLKGEWFIRGDLEVAAQPFLGLSGDLFIELETPWWSPLSDHKWTWPLFGKEWPLGGTMGMLVSVDYVFGSGQWPKFDFKPVEFDSDKFMTSMYDDKAQSGSGKQVEQKGNWAEKNTPAAQPPPKVSPPGNAKPGKSPAPAPAKSKPVASPKTGKPADPNAQTKGGKTVKQLQDEAAKKGKGPAGKEVPKGANDQAAKKDQTKEARDAALKEGLAALDAVTARYAKDGATREEVVTGVKSVRRKFTIFKSIEVTDGSDTWDYVYVYNPKEPRKGPKKALVTDDAKSATFSLLALISVEEGFDPAQMTGLTQPSPYLGTSISYAGRPGLSKAGTAVLYPEPVPAGQAQPKQSRIHVESRNINEGQRKSDSINHGENQLAAWLEQQSWLGQITHIEVHNYNLNPCEVCSGALIDLMNRINLIRTKAGKPLVHGNLTWRADSPWVNEFAGHGIAADPQQARNHIRATISNMNKRGWTVTPGDVDDAGWAKLKKALTHKE